MGVARARVGAAALAAVIGLASVVGAQPANDDCANATVIASLPFSDLGVDMTTATTEVGDPVSGCVGSQGNNSVWYRLPAGAVQDLHRGVTAGTNLDFIVAIWTGSCGSLTEVTCFFTEPDFPEFGVAAEGQEVLIEVMSDGPASGTLDFDFDQTPDFLVDVEGERRITVGGSPNGFLVMWSGETPNAQRYDASGTPVGAQLTIAAGSFGEPDVAGAGNGDFVVVWDAYGGSPQAAGVSGATVTPFPAVSTGSYSMVAADASGNFVVAWDGAGEAQLFDQAGSALGPAFAVSSTGSAGYETSVAMAPSGEFVVAWTGIDDGDDYGIGARLFDANGVPQGSDIVVNSYTTGTQNFPGVGMDAAGNFVVAWEDNGYRYFPGEGYIDQPVMARRFDSSGSPLGPEFLVTTNPDFYPVVGNLDVAVGDGGRFMVVWESIDVVTQIQGRIFDGTGTPEGPQFVVNSVSGEFNYDPDVAATPAGDFMVVWNDYFGFFRNGPPHFTEYSVIGRHFPAPGLACASAALTTCRTPTVPLKSKLLLLDDAADPARGQLRWKFVKGQATDAADLGDPTVDEEYVLCMYDSAGTTVLMENRIFAGGTCGTKPCWKPLGNPPGSKGHRYKNKDRTPHGVLKMVLKPGIEGKSKIVVKGGQANVFTAGPGSPPLPLPLPVTVQLQNSSGECWQATYDTDGVGKNETGFYKGSGS